MFVDAIKGLFTSAMFVSRIKTGTFIIADEMYQTRDNLTLTQAVQLLYVYEQTPPVCGQKDCRLGLQCDE